MIAFGLSILLVLFWAIMGYGLIAAFYPKPNLLQNALLAPSVGLSAILLSVFLINRLGIPVGRFGLGVLIALALFSAFIWWRFRPLVPFRRLLPFAAVLLFALYLNGRPMLEFGFDWVGYGNDDYANYTVNAQRLFDKGYFDPPTASQLGTGQDNSLYSWLLFPVYGSRTGADLVLSWVMSVTGLSGPEVFMPVLLAFHVVLISAASALVCQARRYRGAALITAFLLSISALTTLGAMYQLIAQVLGLALACSVVVVFFRPLASLSRHTAVRLGILGAFLVAALMISYPEITPFIFLAFLAYVGIGLIRKQDSLAWRPLLYAFGILTVLILVVLNFYVLDYLSFVLNQIRIGTQVTSVYVFPYYLIPSGLAAFWGFQPFYRNSVEPWLSLSISLGFVLLVMSGFLAIRYSWRRFPGAVVTAMMFAFGFYLFAKRSDFGLFKLTMFIQPFLLGTVVVAWLNLSRRARRVWRALPLIVIAGAGLATQTEYVEISRGTQPIGPMELAHVSENRILSGFQHLIAQTPASFYIVDTNHPVLAKLQSIALNGNSVDFLAGPSVSPLLGLFTTNLDNTTHFFNLWRSQLLQLSQVFQQSIRQNQFVWNTDHGIATTNAFYTNTYSANIPVEDTVAILTTPYESALNFARLDWFQNDYFIARPLQDVKDFLVFIQSELGQEYYLNLFTDNATRKSTSLPSLFRVQQDYFYPQRSMAGIGRDLLFEVLNPSQNIRIRLDFTASLQANREDLLPSAMAIGAEHYTFPMIGRGSARVFTNPLVPQRIGDRYYVGIDMGVDGSVYPVMHEGLMRLYGTDILLDTRRIVGYMRDLSVISDDEYSHLNPPTRLATFPADLANPDLEYSGIFEDGWLSEASYFCLAQPHDDMQLVIRGQVALIDDPRFTTDLTVSMNNEPMKQQAFGLGMNEVNIPSAHSGRHCIDLRFSDVQRLPNGDNRPVSLLLTYIGYQ